MHVALGKRKESVETKNSISKNGKIYVALNWKEKTMCCNRREEVSVCFLPLMPKIYVCRPKTGNIFQYLQ